MQTTRIIRDLKTPRASEITITDANRDYFKNFSHLVTFSFKFREEDDIDYWGEVDFKRIQERSLYIDRQTQKLYESVVIWDREGDLEDYEGETSLEELMEELEDYREFVPDLEDFDRLTKEIRKMIINYINYETNH